MDKVFIQVDGKILGYEKEDALPGRHNICKILDYLYTDKLAFNAVLLARDDGNYIQFYYKHENNELKTGFPASFYNDVKFDRSHMGYVWLLASFYDEGCMRRCEEFYTHIFDITNKFADKQI